MEEKDLEWYRRHNFSSLEELLSFISRGLPDLEQTIRNTHLQVLPNGDSAHGLQDDMIQKNAEFAAQQIRLVIVEYMHRFSLCKKICINFADGGVPQISDITNDANGIIWFQNGFQPDWFDEIPLKLDVELESFFCDAASWGKQNEYIHALYGQIIRVFDEVASIRIDKSEKRIELSFL